MAVDTSRAMGYGGAQVVNRGASDPYYNVGYGVAGAKNNAMAYSAMPAISSSAGKSFVGSKLPAAPAAAKTGNASASSNYSSMPAIKPQLQQGIESRLQAQLDKPGMDQATVDRMYSRGAEGLAQREASSQQQLQQSAESMGFGRSGDLIAGQRSVASDYSGQRNNLRRDLDISAEEDRLNRGMQAVSAGTDYLNSQRANMRADQSLANQMGQDAWQRENAASQQSMEQQRYDQQQLARMPGLSGGGANASDDPRSAGYWNQGGSTKVTSAPRNEPLPPGTNITSPWLADRRPDLMQPAAPSQPAPTTQSSGGSWLTNFMSGATAKPAGGSMPGITSAPKPYVPGATSTGIKDENGNPWLPEHLRPKGVVPKNGSMADANYKTYGASAFMPAAQTVAWE